MQKTLPFNFNFNLLRWLVSKLSTHMNTQVFRPMKTCLLRLTQKKKPLFKVNPKVSLLEINLVFAPGKETLGSDNFSFLFFFFFYFYWIMEISVCTRPAHEEAGYHLSLHSMFYYWVQQSRAPLCTLYATVNCPWLVNFHIQLSPLPGSLILCSLL